uniref:Bm610 n=1 Tax=Brugia malayi TaxID=6279 RepID=A0A1I9G473_BRUMA|nr:Bm610 [Brugia malayi]
MHPPTTNHERALILTILTGPGSISFATMLPQQPKNFRFPSRRIYRRRKVGIVYGQN